MLPNTGNNFSDTSITLSLKAGEEYYWSVQAIDGVYSSSSFAEKDTITIPGTSFTLLDVAIPGPSNGHIRAGDYNNDGAIDLFAAGHIDKYRLFRNDNCPGNFLNLNLIGTVSTYNAVGAKVILWAEGESITRWVNGGEGKHDFSSFNLEFGLGDKTMVDSLIIYWPGGIVEKMFNIEANQFLTITEGSSPLALVMNPNSIICYGDSVQIFGEASGGSGNYSYLWTPATGLSDPTISHPIAFPEITTTYTLTVDDGVNQISDSTQIIVYPGVYPEITTGGYDTVNINESVMLEAGIYSSYLWQDGSYYYFYLATNTSGPSGGEQVYWVEVVGASGCTGSDTISVWFLPLTEINENKPDISFEVYPNPAKYKISISFGDITGDVEIQILTSDGSMEYKNNLKSDRQTNIRSIDISFLKKGVYFIRLKSLDGKLTGIRKFVKY